ncbi:MAG: hypothetical protein IQL11_09165 [Bacteroidales bacterium]|nr:hypothetical protein [Bacteroidales bacterium]
MKTLTITLAALMVLFTGTVNLEAQPGFTKKGKFKNQNSPKTNGLHDYRGGKKSYYLYNNRDEFINFRGHDYKYSNGRYYARHNRGYRMVPPPYGIRVSYIPRECVSVMVKGRPFFYFEGIFYRHNPPGRYYEVVAPPVGALVPQLPPSGVMVRIVNGSRFLEYDNILFMPVTTRWGVQYRVVRVFNNNYYSYNY